MCHLHPLLAAEAAEPQLPYIYADTIHRASEAVTMIYRLLYIQSRYFRDTWMIFSFKDLPVR